jgi:hypothetical protein
MDRDGRPVRKNDAAEAQEARNLPAPDKLHPAGAVLMLFARSLFLILAQGLASVLFLFQRNPHPFRAAAQGWTVWSTLADLACLFLLIRLTKREGLRLFDLMGPKKQTFNQDLFQALVLFPVLLILDIAGLILGDYLVYGSWLPVGLPAGFAGRLLPLWAVVYSRLVWWPLWSWMEEMTYNGYALPRLQALTGRAWAAVALVTFGWSLQHLFLPTLWDGRYFLWRFLVFIPFNLAAPLIYLHLRRLTPLVFAHWGLDLLTTLVTIA